jgi:hypothetical protein
MRKHYILIAILFLFSPFIYGENVDFSGRIKLFSSVFLSENQYGKYFSHEGGEFAFKRLETRLKLSGEITENVSYSIRFDAFSRPDALFFHNSFPEAGLLGSPTRTEPFELFLYEGYIKISNFILKNFDLTIGKQRIQWGTADKMNVVDNPNPVDFANFFTFDPDYFAERRPQTAINLEFYISNFTKLQFAWLLSRQHSPLPAGFTQMLSSGYRPSVIHIEREKFIIRNTNFGLRFSTVLLNIDLSFSYYHGNFHLPVIYGISMLNIGPINQFYNYPERDIYGIDLSGELFSVGWWAEAAFIKPERTKGFIEIPTFIGEKYQIIRREFSLFEEGYFKWVIGADYTLGIGNGIYLNVQYLHGFFDERDYSNLCEKFFEFRKGMFFGEIEDYLIPRAEYKILNEDLKIEIGGIIEFADNRTAFSFNPSIEYRFSDSFIFKTGVFLVIGEEKYTKFGIFKKDRLIYLLFKLDF